MYYNVIAYPISLTLLGMADLAYPSSWTLLEMADLTTTPYMSIK